MLLVENKQRIPGSVPGLRTYIGSDVCTTTSARIDVCMYVLCRKRSMHMMYVCMAGLRCMYWGHRQKGVRSKRNYFNEPKKRCTTQNSLKLFSCFALRPGPRPSLAEQVLARHRCLSWHLRAHTPSQTKVVIPCIPRRASDGGQKHIHHGSHGLCWPARHHHAPHRRLTRCSWHICSSRRYTQLFDFVWPCKLCSSEVPNIRTRFPPSLLGSRIDRCKHSTTR